MPGWWSRRRPSSPTSSSKSSATLTGWPHPPRSSPAIPPPSPSPRSPPRSGSTCVSRSSRCCTATWGTTSTGRRRCSGRWWRPGAWAGRAGVVSMSTAIELPGLSETQRQIVELAREFARTKIEPFAAEWDRRGYFARDVIDELGRLGFLGMCAPEEYDGMGLDSVTYLLALEEIAAADASVAVSLSIHNAIPTTMLVRHGSPAQRDRWLKAMARGELLAGFSMSEPESGSDAASLTTRAVRDGTSWVLSGAKAWATNGGTADLMMVMARSERGIGAFKIGRASGRERV